MLGVGDVAKNKEAIGLAVKKLGMRPSQGMVEQAVWQFFLCACQRTKKYAVAWFQKVQVLISTLMHSAHPCTHAKKTHLGTRHKMQSRVVKQLLFKFSRIAKTHGLDACSLRPLKALFFCFSKHA